MVASAKAGAKVDLHPPGGYDYIHQRLLAVETRSATLTLPPPIFKPGKPAVPPTRPAPPATTDWFVFGEDHQETGPFTLSQLIHAAQAGQINGTTLLWHAVASKNEWIPASQISLIAAHVAAHVEMPPPPVTKVALRPPKNVRRRAPGLRIARDVIIPGALMWALFLGYQHYTGKRLQMAALTSWFNPPPVVREPPPRPPDQAPPQPRRSASPITAPIASHRENAFQRSDPDPVPEPAGYGRNDGNLGRLLTPPETPLQAIPETVKRESVLLNLESGRQIVELKALDANGSIRLVSVDGFPASTVIDSPGGSIDESIATQIKPFGDESTYLLIKRLSGSAPPKLSIECKTSLDWIGGDDLSADRLKRKRIALVKQLAFLNNALATAANERMRLIAFVEGTGVKRLDAVGAAKNRVNVLALTMTQLTAQIGIAESQISRFDAFCQTLNDTFRNATLVLEQPPSAPDTSQVESPGI